MINLDRTRNASSRPPPLLLLVDSSLTSRHFMWRALSRAFGVIEAGSGGAARHWITLRPDVDALIVQDELPDERGLELVRELAAAHYPAAARSIVLARRSPDWMATAKAGPTLVEPGDFRTVLAKLASWFLAPDSSLAKSLIGEAERLRA
jgi:DNA-binding response OmpR family regulator